MDKIGNILMYLSHIFIRIQSWKYLIIFGQNLEISTIVWCLKFYLLIKKCGSPSKCYDSFVEGIPPIVLKIPNPFWWPCHNVPSYPLSSIIISQLFYSHLTISTQNMTLKKIFAPCFLYTDICIYLHTYKKFHAEVH